MKRWKSLRRALPSWLRRGRKLSRPRPRSRPTRGWQVSPRRAWWPGRRTLHRPPGVFQIPLAIFVNPSPSRISLRPRGFESALGPQGRRPPGADSCPANLQRPDRTTCSQRGPSARWSWPPCRRYAVQRKPPRSAPPAGDQARLSREGSRDRSIRRRSRRARPSGTPLGRCLRRTRTPLRPVRFRRWALRPEGR
jgi:hypothetical protein